LKSEQDLIKTVFANQKGQELLDIWKDVYGDRLSYVAGNTSEDTAFFEGQRAVYLSIIQFLEMKK